ncbi:Panacea domain-containing protein [Mucilaginibacter sp.]|uniref:Panacea domain-containing protein n=1 Tax=Mucilaginibacter sp. TaxID=1882438 RepID=UPI003B0020D4
MTSFKFKKAVQALNFFASKEGGKINYMKAGKLVYLADKAHLRIYGRTITNDSYFAMKNGPVPSGTKDIILKSKWQGQDIVEYSDIFLSSPKGYDINSLKDFDPAVFSKTDLNLMDEIYQNFGQLREFELSDYTHTFPEWLRFKNDLAKDSSRAFQINWDDLFELNIKDIPFKQSEELLNLSKDQFQGIVK